MNVWKIMRAVPPVVAGLVLLVMAVYQLPYTGYYRFRPVLLLSEDAVQTIGGMGGSALDRTITRLLTKNVQGVIFREETLEDLERTGTAFVASGEEVIRLFKLQSVVSYYVYEQVRDKQIESSSSYIFITDAAVFERVYRELRSRLPADSIKIYERGLLRGDASFPDNYILESSLPPSIIRSVTLGWPVGHIRRTLEAVKPRTGDTLWPVLWSEGGGFSAARQVWLDTSLPHAIQLNPDYVRFPFDAIRIVYEPTELITLGRSSDMEGMVSLPAAGPTAILAMGMALIAAGFLRAIPGVAWGFFVTSILLVSALAMLPTQNSWVTQGVASLLPVAALLHAMAEANASRATFGGPLGSWRSWVNGCGRMFVALASAGCVMATLLWQRAGDPVQQWAEYGLISMPAVSTVLLIVLWSLEVSHEPVYPKHLLAAAELAIAGFVLWMSSSEWLVAAAALPAWAKWMTLEHATSRHSIRDTPGLYAAFHIAAALSLKLFYCASPLTAMALMAAAFAGGMAGARLWLHRVERPA